MKVNWNPKKCCHAGVCVKTLPEVFIVEEQGLTIDTSKASEEEIRKVAKLCLAGALEIEE